MPVANAQFKHPDRIAGDDPRLAEVRLTVISYAPWADKGARCGDCGNAGLVFHCHCFEEPGRPVRDLCKKCAIERAGSEDRIWLRTTCRSLPSFWEDNSRPEQSKHLRGITPSAPAL